MCGIYMRLKGNLQLPQGIKGSLQHRQVAVASHDDRNFLHAHVPFLSGERNQECSCSVAVIPIVVPKALHTGQFFQRFIRSVRCLFRTIHLILSKSSVYVKSIHEHFS